MTSTTAELIDAHVAMRTRTAAGEHLDDTEQIKALATLLEHETATFEDDPGTDNVMVEILEPARLEALLKSAARTLRELVNDRDSLMAARDWETQTFDVHQIAMPERDESAALIAQLEAEAAELVTLSRKQVLAHVFWFQSKSTRNFIALQESSDRRNAGARPDTFGIGPVMVQNSIEHLRELAQEPGVVLTPADLDWALNSLGRLRSPIGEDVTPPCTRALA